MSNKNPARLISIDSETGSYWYGGKKVQTDEKFSALLEMAALRKSTFHQHIDQSTQRVSSIKSTKSGYCMP